MNNYQRIRSIMECMGAMITSNGNQARYVFTCAKCIATHSHPYKRGFSPDLAIRDLRRKGWQAEFNMIPLCPAHKSR